MVTGIPMPTYGMMAKAFLGMAAEGAVRAVKESRTLKAAGDVALGGALRIGEKVYDVYNDRVRVPVGVAGLVLTGGGINPLDLNQLAKATPDIACAVAIRGLDAFLRVIDPKSQTK